MCAVIYLLYHLQNYDLHHQPVRNAQRRLRSSTSEGKVDIIRSPLHSPHPFTHHQNLQCLPRRQTLRARLTLRRARLYLARDFCGGKTLICVRSSTGCLLAEGATTGAGLEDGVAHVV